MRKNEETELKANRAAEQARAKLFPHILKSLAVTVLTVVLSAAAHAQTSATLVDFGAAAPVPGTSDISQLSTSGAI